MSKMIKLNVVGRESTVYLENVKLKSAIEKVRELHLEIQMGDDYFICDYDNNIYPCPTIKALDGEQ